MAYEVRFKDTAAATVERLPEAIRLRAIAKAESLADDPRPRDARKLKGAVDEMDRICHSAFDGHTPMRRADPRRVDRHVRRQRDPGLRRRDLFEAFGDVVVAFQGHRSCLTMARAAEEVLRRLPHPTSRRLT